MSTPHERCDTFYGDPGCYYEGTRAKAPPPPKALNVIVPTNRTKAIYNFHHDWYCNDRFLTKSINTLRPRQNGRHLPDISKCIFLNENIGITIDIWLKFVPKGSINNIPALVQIMAWCHPGAKPLSEPMMIISLMHICVIRPQWINSLWLSDAILLTWFQVSACCLAAPNHYCNQCWPMN